MITAKEALEKSEEVEKFFKEARQKEIEQEHLDCLKRFEKCFDNRTILSDRSFNIVLTRTAAKEKEELGFKVTPLESQTCYRTCRYRIEW